MDDVAALLTLRRLGYLPGEEWLDQKVARFGIERFQRYYNLRDRSGSLNGETKKALELPRCGFPDVAYVLNERRLNSLSKQGGSGFLVFRIERLDVALDYVQPKGWPTEDRPFTLLYKFGSGAGSSRQAAVYRAMKQWSLVKDLVGRKVVEFKPSNGLTPDFTVDWVGGLGNGSMEVNDVADACLPLVCTPDPVRFNSIKSWSTSMNPDPGALSVQAVALHELGHVLGLVHPAVRGDSIMDLELGEGKTPDLKPEDEQALRDLYK